MRTAKQIAQEMKTHVDEICRYLLPNGRRRGNEYAVGSVHGEEGKSLSVHLSGEKAGVWSDFAGEGAGDLLELWQQVRNISLTEACHEVSRYFGWETDQSFNRKKEYQKPQVKNGNAVLDEPSALEYLKFNRKLTNETLSAFKLQANDKQVIFPFYRDDELLLVKYLKIERDKKKEIFVSPNAEPCLFGWQAIYPKCRSVTLTEGEIDAMSLHQMGYNALSVPFGGGKGKKHEWIENEFDNLAIFDEIYICFDNDKEGKIAAIEVSGRLGRHRCRIVELPFKDANECLKQNVQREAIETCFKNSATLDPEELKPAHIFVNEVIHEFHGKTAEECGISLPFADHAYFRHSNLVRLRTEELSVWTGINAHGKSQLIGQVILHSMHCGQRVCIASLEMSNTRLLTRLTRQATLLPNPTIEYIQKVHEWYEDKLWLFNVVGSAKDDKLLEVFEYAHKRYGVSVFVIDSLMKCGFAEDDYNKHKLFIEKLCDFKNQYGVHVHLITHPRKAMDETRVPTKMDIKGTGAVTDLADNCFVIWRNKIKERKLQDEPNNEDQQKRPDAILICEKQRNGEWEGKIPLWFHRDSFQFISGSGDRPHRYVRYSKMENKS